MYWCAISPKPPARPESSAVAIRGRGRLQTRSTDFRARRRSYTRTAAMSDVPPSLRRLDGTVRCWWATSDPLYVAYHDDEWGRPVRDDTRLFEKLVLEGFQSGLSWLTILRKR